MLPSPTLTFTIPSLHDNVVLDCRVFHPASLSASPKAPPWRKHAAVVAHPYAPLGGSYDDQIVDVVAGTLLRLGFLVGTFNFRGAGSSAGRTSWNGIPEKEDYMSFAAFMYYYTHFLDPFRDDDGGGGLSSPATSPHPSSGSCRGLEPLPPPPVLLLAGYSYGGLITTLLPSLPTILAPFDRPVAGSAAAEIRLRAASLAAREGALLASARAAATAPSLHPKSPSASSSHRKTLGVRVGGDEELGRSSHDARRSFSLEETMSDLVARAKSGVGKSHHSPHSPHRHKKSNSADSTTNTTAAASSPTTPTKKNKKKYAFSPPPPHSPTDGGGNGGSNGGSTPTSNTSSLLPAIPNLLRVRPAYLLVSPPIGLIGNLATMSFPPLFPSLFKKFRRGTNTHAHAPSSEEEEEEDTPSPPTAEGEGKEGPPADDADEPERKMAVNPTLAIYGDADVFLNNKRVRAWAAQLRGIEGSRFTAHEVSTAGHFWREGRTLYALRDAVVAFAESLLKGE